MACECDNTHRQNDTVCRWCWARGRRHWGDPDVDPKSPRVNKWVYMWYLQGNYGQGFEDLIGEESKQDILARKREYIANDSFAHAFRIIRRREANPAYREY